MLLVWGDGIAQGKRSRFPPSQPGFDSRRHLVSGRQINRQIDWTKKCCWLNSFRELDIFYLSLSDMNINRILTEEQPNWFSLQLQWFEFQSCLGKEQTYYSGKCWLLTDHTMLTSESELIERRYMETPTMTAGPGTQNNETWKSYEMGRKPLSNCSSLKTHLKVSTDKYETRTEFQNPQQNEIFIWGIFERVPYWVEEWTLQIIISQLKLS